MDNYEKDAALRELTHFAQSAVTGDDKQWATLPTRIFSEMPRNIPELWARGLIDVIWTPRALELRQHVKRKKAGTA